MFLFWKKRTDQNAKIFKYLTVYDYIYNSKMEVECVGWTNDGEDNNTLILLAIDSLIVHAGGFACCAAGCFPCKTMEFFHVGALRCARCVASSSWRWSRPWSRIIIWGWNIFVTIIIITMTNSSIIINPVLLNVFIFTSVPITLECLIISYKIWRKKSIPFIWKNCYNPFKKDWMYLTGSLHSKLAQTSSSSVAVPCLLRNMTSSFPSSWISTLNAEQHPPWKQKFKL